MQPLVASGALNPIHSTLMITSSFLTIYNNNNNNNNKGKAIDLNSAINS